MELNEVKIGDTVSFTHKGKKVTGKVIYRHDGNKNAALAGHINIQPMDADSRPHTIHVSKTRPATQIKEDIQMSDINEAILDLIDNIQISEPYFNFFLNPNKYNLNFIKLLKNQHYQGTVSLEIISEKFENKKINKSITNFTKLFS